MAENVLEQRIIQGEKEYYKKPKWKIMFKNR